MAPFKWLDIIWLAVLEGLTEFLPVSSTGHLIVAAELLQIAPSDALTSLLVIIQVGAILAVVSIYRHTLLNWVRAWLQVFSRKLVQRREAEDAARHRRYSLLIVAAVIPFGLVGYLNRDLIRGLFTPGNVAVALIVGGVLMLLESVWSRRRVPPCESGLWRTREDFTLKDVLIIGCGQCLALWPGFSRAAATILAARVAGYSRPAAAELSFLIGLPTILGTGAYEIREVQWDMALLPYILVGSLIAWLVAWLSVKWLLAWLQKYSLNVFGWYRIGLGGLILWVMVI